MISNISLFVAFINFFLQYFFNLVELRKQFDFDFMGSDPELVFLEEWIQIHVFWAVPIFFMKCLIRIRPDPAPWLQGRGDGRTFCPTFFVDKAPSWQKVEVVLRVRKVVY